MKEDNLTRDERLLIAGYDAGWSEAALYFENGGNPSNVSGADKARQWINNTVADNGATVGDYICHTIDAPLMPAIVDPKKKIVDTVSANG